MNYPISTAPELPAFEIKYGDLCDDTSPMTEPIKTSRERLQALRLHTARPRPTPAKPYSSVTSHLHDSLSMEVAHAEKGARPAYVVRAEHSLDQLLEILHELGQTALENDLLNTA